MPSPKPGTKDATVTDDSRPARAAPAAVAAAHPGQRVATDLPRAQSRPARTGRTAPCAPPGVGLGLTPAGALTRIPLRPPGFLASSAMTVIEVTQPHRSGTATAPSCDGCQLHRRGGRDLRHHRAATAPARPPRWSASSGLRRPDARHGPGARPGPAAPTATELRAPGRRAAAGERRCPTGSRVRRGAGAVRLLLPRPGRPAQLMAELGLDGSADTAFAKLSGGQKQRLSIALALVGYPRVGDPRRADHRAGPAGPPRHLGADPSDTGPGRDDRAGHPLHGRGGAAVRPDRRHPRRPGRRAGHPGRADRRGSPPGRCCGSAPRAPLDPTRCWPRCRRSLGPRTGGDLTVVGTAGTSARAVVGELAASTSSPPGSGRAGQPRRRLHRADRSAGMNASC